MNHSDDKGWSYPFETLPEWGEGEKETFTLWEDPGSDTACVIYHVLELRGMSDWTGAIALLKNKAEPKLLFAEIGYDTPDWSPAYSENGQFLFMKTYFWRDGQETTAFLILDMLQERFSFCDAGPIGYHYTVIEKAPDSFCLEVTPFTLSLHKGERKVEEMQPIPLQMDRQTWRPFSELHDYPGWWKKWKVKK